jgi:hypothetical protein
MPDNFEHIHHTATADGLRPPCYCEDVRVGREMRRRAEREAPACLDRETTEQIGGAQASASSLIYRRGPPKPNTDARKVEANNASELVARVMLSVASFGWTPVSSCAT